MKRLYALITMLLFAAVSGAQDFKLGPLMKPGVRLIYEVQAGSKTYDFTVTIKDKSGKTFDWIMGAPVNTSGSISQAAGLKAGDVLFNYFSNGNKTLDSRTTSVWLSQKLFNHFDKSAGKPIKVYAYGAAAAPLEMGTFTGSIPLEILVDGKSQMVSAELVKPLVKSGTDYIVGAADESIHYYSDKISRSFWG